MEQNYSKGKEEFKIVGNWDIQSKLLKERFSFLTKSELKFETGKEIELLKRLERKLNKNREEVIAIINRIQTKRP